jgi:hypothetical protein
LKNLKNLVSVVPYDKIADLKTQISKLKNKFKLENYLKNI